MLMYIMIELHIFFDSDMKKCVQWLETENPNLGGTKPIELIKRGKTKKLYQFVKAAVNENECF